METVRDFIFLGSKITAEGDSSHEIKRHLLLGRKSMTNLDSILKSRDITLPTKVCLVKAMVFPVVMYRCESWAIKKAECWRIDAFEWWCWRRLLRVPRMARRSNQSILKQINLEYSLEGLKLKLQCFLAAGSFLVSWLFVSHGQSIGASATVLPMTIQGWFHLGLTGLISLQSKGLEESSPASQLESVSSLVLSFLYGPILTSFHGYWENHSFDYMDLFWLLNMLF